MTQILNSWCNVQRSAVFMTLLLSLFMFQSFWNVAAAFCAHENLALNATSSGHFGHHVALDCEQNQIVYQHQHAHAPLQFEQAQPAVVVDGDDHSDHLPSFAHFIMVDEQQSAQQPLFTAHLIQPQFDWHNLYQSPHLYVANPPPVLTPL